MRESIGSVSLLNFIIFFILLIFAFLMGTYSYYKAYRVNNSIVSAIEKFEGYNDYSKEEIEIKLKNLGYEMTNFNCATKDNYELLDTPNGYCIYLKQNDYEKDTDMYYSYEVTTIIKFQFPIIQDILKLRVNSRTTRLYDFNGSATMIKNKNIEAENEKNRDIIKDKLGIKSWI